MEDSGESATELTSSGLIIGKEPGLCVIGSVEKKESIRGDELRASGFCRSIVGEARISEVPASNTVSLRVWEPLVLASDIRKG